MKTYQEWKKAYFALDASHKYQSKDDLKAAFQRYKDGTDPFPTAPAPAEGPPPEPKAPLPKAKYPIWAGIILIVIAPIMMGGGYEPNILDILLVAGAFLAGIASFLRERRAAFIIAIVLLVDNIYRLIMWSRAPSGGRMWGEYSKQEVSVGTICAILAGILSLFAIACLQKRDEPQAQDTDE